MPRRTTLHLQKPSSELAAAYVARYDSDDMYSTADRALTILFQRFPKNSQLEEVLLKVVALNRLYSTNIYNVIDVAKHIVAIRPDSGLSEGSVAVVDAMAEVEINGRRRRNYSFATKYCSWHRPDAYPIYDTYVERILWAFQAEYPFAGFRRSDLRDYSRFKAVLESFRDRFGLGHLTFKEIDKFLWYYAKEMFG